LRAGHACPRLGHSFVMTRVGDHAIFQAENAPKARIEAFLLIDIRKFPLESESKYFLRMTPPSRGT
jgi:hypothetical protein